MQVALFGAAFDPPHLGHLAVLTAVLERGLADEVWLVPAKSHPFGKPLTDPKHRIEMLKLLITDDGLTNQQKSALKIESFELENPTISYTSITLTEMSRRYPEHTFSFVMGSDNLARFHEWEGQEVLAQYPFWIYPRVGYPLQPLRSHMKIIENVTEVNISSTLIRRNIAQEASIDQLVTESIKTYIASHKLYI